jgi:hypothetical protein
MSIVLNTLTANQYVDALNSDLFMASGKAPAEIRYVLINGLSIRLSFLAAHSANIIMPAFQHIECASLKDVSLSVVICDRESSSALLYQSPWRDQIEQCRDKILMANDENFHMQYNPDSKIYSVINTETKTAYYYSNDFAEIPYYEKSAPLKSILHWWCEQHDMCLVHAAAVGVNDSGVLLVGRGGTGKSTTAVSAAVHGLQFAGDDYVVLSKDPLTSAVSIYCSAKVNDDVLPKLPALHCHITNPVRQDSEKAVIFLNQNFRSVWANKIQLKAIVIPKISKGKACLKKSSPVQVFAEVAASTIFQMPGSGSKTLRTLKDIFQELPVYTFELGTDFSQNMRVLQEFCVRLSEHD